MSLLLLSLLVFRTIGKASIFSLIRSSRARQLFSLIDSLKTTRSGKQQSCFVFKLDDQTTVERVSEDKGSGKRKTLGACGVDIVAKVIRYCLFELKNG